MLKIISFSLWGNDHKYIIGAIKNAILALKIYPDWICRFYIDNIAIQNSNIEYLKILPNTQIINIDLVGDWTFNIFRFFPLSENVDFMISRDCDSRLSYREKYAVEQWIQSEKTFHIMKDHPFQFNFPILAGMFGSKRLFSDYDIFKKVLDVGHFSDQVFLQQHILPTIKEDCIIHDSIHNTGVVFPTKRINHEFVGDVFDILDNRHPEFWKHINE